VVFITHSIDEAIYLSDRVVIMDPRPGRVAEILEVDIPRPRWKYDVRSEPKFVELRKYAWDYLRSQIRSANA
jgi:NitT/TauT family transport system ATP-binding protein